MKSFFNKPTFPFLRNNNYDPMPNVYLTSISTTNPGFHAGHNAMHPVSPVQQTRSTKHSYSTKKYVYIVY